MLENEYFDSHWTYNNGLRGRARDGDVNFFWADLEPHIEVEQLEDLIALDPEIRLSASTDVRHYYIP